jgi:hypothetical protein
MHEIPQGGFARFPLEQQLMAHAEKLESQGLNVATYISPGDPYLGKTIEMGYILAEDPKKPGQHIQIDMVEGNYSNPQIIPGSLDRRLALEAMEADNAADLKSHFDDTRFPYYPIIEGSDADVYRKQIEDARKQQYHMRYGPYSKTNTPVNILAEELIEGHLARVRNATR